MTELMPDEHRYVSQLRKEFNLGGVNLVALRHFLDFLETGELNQERRAAMQELIAESYHKNGGVK